MTRPISRRSLLALALAPVCARGGALPRGGQLRFCLRSEPKTFHPLLVEEGSSETSRYLTGGVLIRVNRQTQLPEPDLALSWKTSPDGRRIIFQLREGVTFSDGGPFSSADVAFTLRALLDPQLHSPTGDAFRSGAGSLMVEAARPDRVTTIFPAPVAGLERLFDQVAILPSGSPLPPAGEGKPPACLGPFVVAEYKPGDHVLLRRNPRYWKTDPSGRRLPYLDSIRLDIQRNREVELLRFRRGEIHLINNLDSEHFEQLSKQGGLSAHDAGPSLEAEMIWFNQVAAAPIPAHQKQWFRAQGFRRAVSEAIHREDLCRVVYHGHATAGAGPISPANRLWFHQGLKPHAFDPRGALGRLEAEGFRRERGGLVDRQGHAVEFSLITNAGNKSRERMAAMVQQDLAQIGIRLNVVALDFSSLLERITRTFHYEACLLGLVNVDLDPNGQMNVWLSSSSNHQWNPRQKSPETPWEAEIDRLMTAQPRPWIAARERRTSTGCRKSSGTRRLSSTWCTRIRSRLPLLLCATTRLSRVGRRRTGMPSGYT